MGEHCEMAKFRRSWKCEMEVLEMVVGSGRRQAAASEAFAMATWWEDMVGVVVDFVIWSVRLGFWSVHLLGGPS